jgi:hypothetical protein
MASDETALDWRNLVQENGALRTIISELLIINQELRWKLQASVHREMPFSGHIHSS